MISIVRKKFNSWCINSQLFVLLCLLNFLDFYSTKLLIDHDGYDAEGNPFLRWMVYQLDTAYAILYIKIFFLCLFGYFYYTYITLNKHRQTFLLKAMTSISWLLVFALSLICINNLLLVYFTVLT